MNVCIRFGKNVRFYRLALGVSQEELAHDADSNRTYISDLERGTRNPSLEVVERIAKSLNVSMGCLLYTSPSPRDGLLSRMPSSA